MDNWRSHHSLSETDDRVVALPANSQDLSAGPAELKDRTGSDRKTVQEPRRNIPQMMSAKRQTTFHSLLYERPETTLTAEVEQGDRTFASDLNLDHIIRAIVKGREEADLITAWFYQGVRDPDMIGYRHEVFRDLEHPPLFERIKEFAHRMRQVRLHLAQIQKMEVHYQRQGWFLDAAILYCQAVDSLNGALGEAPLSSRGLLAFREFLAEYAASPVFTSLKAASKECKSQLEGVRYCVQIRGARVEVRHYQGETDYSAEVLETFKRFKQGAARDYRAVYRTWPGMNHIGAEILDMVSRLFSDEFSALDEYCSRYAGFLDSTIRRFERELQFYLSYLDYIAAMRSAGLNFCYPEVSCHCKDTVAMATFDLALAYKLVEQGMPVVCNDFTLGGAERVLVISGPNQGGKTTFARCFGQLHHLARIGCPIPGTVAKLFLADRILTHFEREEDLTRMRGQLEDDIVRVGEVLQAATTDSILVMNESFASTTLRDAIFLGKKVLQKVLAMDLLCVYVTFIEELAAFDPAVVSMVSTVVPEHPVERTFKVVRAPADGLAYAIAIAEKYNLTYERLRRRIAP